MKGMILIEAHEWRGVRRDRDLFYCQFCIGVVTVAVSRELVSDRLRRFINMLRIGRADD